MSDRIFLAVSFQGLFALSEFITSIVFRLTVNVVSKPSTDLMNLVPINIYPVLILLISILLFLRKRFIKGISFPYTILLLLTPVVTVASVFNLSINDSYFLYPKSYLVFILCLLIINCSTYILLDFSLKAALEKEYYQHLQQQNQYQQEKYEQLSVTYRKLQSYQHDTKKQLLFIKECINENRIEAILPYMEESLDNLEKSYGRIHTGNLVIDSFLSNYSLLAEKNKIGFTTDLSVNPSLIPVKDYDLSIILGNLLDNAINACLKQTDTDNRKIDVYIFTDEKAGQMIIHITNTTIKNVTPEPINGLIHGYGLANVEECVKKHFGILHTTENDENYEASAIIPLCPPSTDTSSNL
jgi:sensor histidine kinase YesM